MMYDTLISGDSFLDEEVASYFNATKWTEWPNIETKHDYENLEPHVKNISKERGFVQSTEKSLLLENVFGQTYINMARSGAGNEYISHSVIETCIKYPTIKKVFVLWSGVSRVDIPFGDDVISSVNNLLHRVTKLGEINWLHTGGILGSHQSYPSNHIINKYVKNQHQGNVQTYQTRKTLYHLLLTETFLKSRNIDYTFGWIYNPLENNNDNNIANELTLNCDCNLYKEIDWNNILNSFPYNYCKEKGYLSHDNWHPTTNGYKEWFASIGLS